MTLIRPTRRDWIGRFDEKAMAAPPARHGTAKKRGFGPRPRGTVGRMSRISVPRISDATMVGSAADARYERP